MSHSHKEAWAAVRAAASGGSTWIKGRTRRVSYADLQDRVMRMAGFARARGLGIGDRVVLSTADDEEAALIFVGLVLNGLTAVTIDPDAGADRARALIKHAEPSLILVDSALVDRWQLSAEQHVLAIEAPVQSRSLMGRLRPLPQGGFVGLVDESEALAPPDDIDGDVLAYVLFTSGTTNQPKGVCISHQALFSHLATLSRVYGMGSKSVLLNILMLSHADGMIQGPILALVNRALLLRPMKFEVNAMGDLLDTIYRLRVTHMIAVPTMLSLILKLSSSNEDAFRGGDFKLLVSCGAALEAGLWESFEETLGASIINVYGLTETVAGGIFAGAIVGTRAPGTIGLPIDCETRIVGSTNEEMNAGVPGELWMRGNLIMSGYFNAPDLTSEVLDADGWLHTGDVAVRDHNGLLTISGRKKNIVIRGGYNIHPEEVSEVLSRHPAVRDAVAFGLPDEHWGERLVAIVGSSAATESELMHFASEHLEPRKIPSRIAITPEVPKGRSGKASLAEARALFDEIEKAARSAPDSHAEGLEQRLLAVAARCFRADSSTLKLTSAPNDLLGWDSMAHMEFVISIEDEFGVKLTPRDVMSIDRLDRAVELIRRLPTKPAS